MSVLFLAFSQRPQMACLGVLQPGAAHSEQDGIVDVSEIDTLGLRDRLDLDQWSAVPTSQPSLGRTYWKLLWTCTECLYNRKAGTVPGVTPTRGHTTGQGV